MARHLFEHVNLDERRVHLLNGRAADLEAECARYERALGRAGGMDLLVVGLGVNGHIGFNEPAARLTARTHVAELAAATRRANAGWFGNRVTAVPRRGLSMGLATLLGASAIVVVATGLEKADAVARMLSGPLTCRVPASFLQTHRDCEAWVDRAALSGFTARATNGIRPLRAVRAGGARHPRRSHRA
jgi:glucosamine-6-phosphate deaminase